MKLRTILTTILFALSISNTFAKNIFVDQNTPLYNGNGLHWQLALQHLQTAISMSSSGDTIFIAQGTYYPDEGIGIPNNSNNYFTLKKGVVLFGGYPSGGGVRNVHAHQTILSGELQQDTILTNNSDYIMKCPKADSNTVIDGIYFEDSKIAAIDLSPINNQAYQVRINNCTFSNFDGATYIIKLSSSLLTSTNYAPTITNCYFANNSLSESVIYAFYVPDNSNISIKNCFFYSNTSQFRGSSIFCNLRIQCQLHIINCVFYNNQAWDFGGALYLRTPHYSSQIFIDGCRFTNNSSQKGGAIRFLLGKYTVTNSIFSNNSTPVEGGAIATYSNDTPAISNCTFYNNTANLGNSIYNGDKLYLHNCILWNNQSTTGNQESIYTQPGPHNHTYIKNCIIKNSNGSGSNWLNTLGTDLGGNIDTDPLFVNPASGLFQLQTCPPSPAINAGSDSIITSLGIMHDAALNSRIFDSIIDIGAYESQTMAGFSRQNTVYTINAGDSIAILGTYYKYPITIFDTILGSPCNIIHRHKLKINPQYNIDIYDTICFGDSVLYHSQYLNKEGIYSQKYASNQNYDSIVNVHITHLPYTIHQMNANICSGHTYTFSNGQTANKTGVYLIPNITSGSCDSVNLFSLIVDNPVSSHSFINLCPNDSFILPSGAIAHGQGLFFDTISTNQGCDSVNSYRIYVKSTIDTNNVEICSSDQYLLPGGGITSLSGIYNDTLTNQYGCDSIIVTDLISKPISDSVLYDHFCENYPYQLPNGNYTFSPGTYTDTLINKYGCDSISTLILSMIPSQHTTLNDYICEGSSYILPNGNSVNNSGIYQVTIANQQGCDSTITVSLVEKQAFHTAHDIFFCKGDTFTLPNGQTITTAGNYHSNFQTTFGCDSVITTHAHIYPPILFNFGSDITVPATLGFVLSGSSNYDNFLWSTGDTTLSIYVDSSLINVDSTAVIWLQITDSNSCKAADTIKVIFTGTIGISEAHTNSSVKVFPNPGSDVLYIQAKQPIDRIRLISSGGKTVKLINPSEKLHKMDISTIASGNYILEIVINNQRTERHIIKL
jgi:hypothetical protein